jgi:hypothetical protein
MGSGNWADIPLPAFLCVIAAPGSMLLPVLYFREGPVYRQKNEVPEDLILIQYKLEGF